MFREKGWIYRSSFVYVMLIQCQKKGRIQDVLSPVGWVLILILDLDCDWSSQWHTDVLAIAEQWLSSIRVLFAPARRLGGAPPWEWTQLRQLTTEQRDIPCFLMLCSDMKAQEKDDAGTVVIMVVVFPSRHYIAEAAPSGKWPTGFHLSANGKQWMNGLFCCACMALLHLLNAFILSTALLLLPQWFSLPSCWGMTEWLGGAWTYPPQEYRRRGRNWGSNMIMLLYFLRKGGKSQGWKGHVRAHIKNRLCSMNTIKGDFHHIFFCMDSKWDETRLLLWNRI